MDVTNIRITDQGQIMCTVSQSAGSEAVSLIIGYISYKANRLIPDITAKYGYRIDKKFIYCWVYFDGTKHEFYSESRQDIIRYLTCKLEG